VSESAGGSPTQVAGSDASGIQPTARLLWLACHRDPDPVAVARALDAGADPSLAVAAAVGHRVAGLLWRAIEAAGAIDALGEHRPRLEQAVEVQRLRELLLVPRALELAVTPLVEAGLEPLVLKGPAVAARYPGTGLRPFDDLDLLLPRQAHAKAEALLRKAGWELAQPRARDRYDSVLVHGSLPDMPLELHYALEAWYDRASSLRAEDLWARRRPLELFGVPAFGLPVADELVVLCAHAAKPYHGFARLVWVADLAMILGGASEEGEEVDWERVRGLAVEGRCVTAVAAALSLAALAGADSPPALRALPQKGWRGEALRRLAEGEWVFRGAPPIHLRFALADDRRRRLALLIGYTHPMPGFQGLQWRLGTAGHAVRRWRDLRERAAGSRRP